MRLWSVLHLILPQEFEGPVSNFLMEQGAAGLEEEEVEKSKEIKLKAYFLQDGRKRRVVWAIQGYLRSLEKIFSKKIPYQISTVLLPEQDWGENWKKYFRPVRVGARFVVLPPWERVRLKEGQIPIEITPGMAFGIGTHATTQLCMKALERRLKKKGDSVLDVGTGSGILAIAAAKLGAREVWGIDIDPAAVEVARENVERNGVRGIVRIRRGSIGRVQKKFDLVVANIDFKGLKRLRTPLLHHLDDKGFLILSGILKKEQDRISRLYSGTEALRFIEVDHRGEWASLTFKKKGTEG